MFGFPEEPAVPAVLLIKVYPISPVVVLYVAIEGKFCNGKGVMVKLPPFKSITTLPVTPKLPVIIADPVYGNPSTSISTVVPSVVILAKPFPKKFRVVASVSTTVELSST